MDEEFSRKKTASGHYLYPADYLCDRDGECFICFLYAGCEKAGSDRGYPNNVSLYELMYEDNRPTKRVPGDQTKEEQKNVEHQVLVCFLIFSLTKLRS
jgi:hypothetical protein